MLFNMRVCRCQCSMYISSVYVSCEVSVSEFVFHTSEVIHLFKTTMKIGLLFSNVLHNGHKKVHATAVS